MLYDFGVIESEARTAATDAFTASFPFKNSTILGHYNSRLKEDGLVLRRCQIRYW